ncbi:MAG: site-specific integrase [Chloroflexi bacterium]|nr:site-specific integrase [Chloroflexota bacterium]
MSTTNTGTTYQRSDGRWCASLQVNGKRRVLYGKTEREARRKLAMLQRQIATTGTLPDHSRRSLAELIDAWLESAELRPKTLAGYRQTLALILPHVGHLKLPKLEPAHLQRLYADLGKTSKRNAYRAHLLLHHALKLAVLWNWLPSNPADRVVKPKYRAERKEVWTAEQLRRFLDGTTGHQYNALWTVLACTGCRLGEALGLRWEDLDGAVVAIRRNLQYVAGRWVESAPKTKAGDRSVTLPVEGVAVLRRQKARQAEWKLKAGAAWRDTRGLVFTTTGGRPLQQTWVQNDMKAECDRLGLPGLTPHGLRHLHASLLLEHGLPIPTVAAQMGHANANVTLAIYAHALKRQDEEAARVMQSVLAANVI